MTEHRGGGHCGNLGLHLSQAPQDTRLRACGCSFCRAYARSAIRTGRSAIILTRSQSGPFGWLIADARPKLVKAVIAVEPAGPPFENAVFNIKKARAWGVTDIPITYDPPVDDPTELKTEQQTQPDAPDVVPCWQQQAPARRLTNLINTPAVVTTTEASYHAAYDHCTAKYLAQAGVRVTALRLGDHGIHGNGHMVMLEKNNLQVAGVIVDWLARTVPAH